MKRLFHIYTGDGKGKSTAALGMALRAYGQGFKVFYCQFLKSGKSGEFQGLEKLRDRVYAFESPAVGGFISRMDPEEKEKVIAEQRRMFAEVSAMVLSGDYDLAILDEAVTAYGMGVLPQEDVRNFIVNRPENTELVFTGRNASEELLALADYASEIVKLKHPYDQGVKMRKGIEF